MRPQPGIFAVGIPEHCYVEFDTAAGAEPVELVRRLAALSGPETTLAGVSLVVGFAPGLWAHVAPLDSPPGVTPFEAVTGPEVTFPATQHDAWLWIAGGARDHVFDSTVRAFSCVEGTAVVRSEVTGWVYRNNRDLTGFIDGTENPSMLEAASVAVSGEGPGAGSSVLLFQQWSHSGSWAGLAVEAQEQVIGRTKADSVELDEERMPVDSHVSRNVVEEDGRELRIYRRNTSYGGPSEHGTIFVGFCAEQHPLDVMLKRMAGVGDGRRDALTRYATAVSGAYYVIPSVDALRRFIPDE